MTGNPWFSDMPLTTEPEPQTVTEKTETVEQGVVSPQQRSVTPPDVADRLGAFAATATPLVWVLGTHGGAGETTVAGLIPGAAAAGHLWPDQHPEPAVVLTARTHPAGLRAAQLAMRCWAAGVTPQVRLLGLVLVADAPGKLPREIRDHIAVLRGGVPRLWQLGWDEHHRLGDLEQPTTSTRRVAAQIRALAQAPQEGENQ